MDFVLNGERAIRFLTMLLLFARLAAERRPIDVASGDASADEDNRPGKTTPGTATGWKSTRNKRIHYRMDGDAWGRMPLPDVASLRARAYLKLPLTHAQDELRYVFHRSAIKAFGNTF